MTTTRKPVRCSLREVSALWQSRTPFNCNNTLRGFEGTSATMGQLPQEWRNVYRNAEDREDIAFTVVSYSTPIAWVLNDGEIVKPPVKYSVTTSKHQGKIY